MAPDLAVAQGNQKVLLQQAALSFVVFLYHFFNSILLCSDIFSDIKLNRVDNYVQNVY